VFFSYHGIGSLQFLEKKGVYTAIEFQLPLMLVLFKKIACHFKNLSRAVLGKNESITQNINSCSSLQRADVSYIFSKIRYENIDVNSILRI
jgi:hypothetical protein